MRIAYSNLVDDATLTASSEDSRYPVENVQNQRLGKPWRTLVATGVTCVVNLGSALDVTTIAIAGHAFTGSAAVTIEANASDSWGSPSFSTSLTILDGVILKFLAAAQTYQYWRFVIGDDGATVDYLDIGRLWLGEYIQLTPSSTYDFKVSKKRSDMVSYGRGRQKFATIGVGWREFDLSFRSMEGTALTEVQTMYDSVGKHSSIIFCNFDSLRDYELVEPCYCSIENDIEFGHARYQRYDWSLRLTEDK